MARLGLGGRHFRKRWSRDSRAEQLHTLLDKVLAEGVPPVEIESGLADLLNLAKRRRNRDNLQLGRRWRSDDQR